MHRYLLTILLALMLGMNARAQDTDTAEDAEAPDAAAEVPAQEEDEYSGFDEELDEESYADAEEEDFVPTEDIPTDQAIPFPTDI